MNALKVPNVTRSVKPKSLNGGKKLMMPRPGKIIYWPIPLPFFHTQLLRSSQGSLFESSCNVEITEGQLNSIQGHQANLTINFNRIFFPSCVLNSVLNYLRVCREWPPGRWWDREQHAITNAFRQDILHRSTREMGQSRGVAQSKIMSAILPPYVIL